MSQQLLETTVEQELLRFEEIVKSMNMVACSVTPLAPYILKLQPKNEIPQAMKPITFGIVALIHGNEVLGLPIINSFLEEISSGSIPIGIEILVALGNVPAALAKKRFLCSDLNRSFGLNSEENTETIRAQELERHFLDHCDFVLDLHQTIEPSKSPFFMFKYFSKKQFSMMREINPGLPVVFTLDSIHQQKGVTTNEYLRRKSSIGITLELGEKGFFKDNFDLGLSVAKRMLEVLNNPAELDVARESSHFNFTFPILKLETSFRIEHNNSRLNEGWLNLMEITKNQIIGTSSQGSILSPISGFIIFPKYSSIMQLIEVNLAYKLT